MRRNHAFWMAMFVMGAMAALLAVYGCATQQPRPEETTNVSDGCDKPYWQGQLDRGELTQDDYNFLVRGCEEARE